MMTDTLPLETAAGRRSQTKPRGYIDDYRPSAKTRALLDQVDAVLAEYRDYLPLTVRQILYRLLGGPYGYTLDDKEPLYERLCNHLNLARRGGRISFDAIRDDSIVVIETEHYEDEEGFRAAVQDMARHYRRDKLARQPVYLEVWCESSGMMPQLARVANRYSVAVYSCSGFDSTSARKQIAERVVANWKSAVVLHLSDFDPSGEAIFRAMAEDVAAFVTKDRYDARQSVHFVRVALTAAQVAGYDLPTVPAKATDKRTKGWAAARGSDQTCQLEALPPDTIAELLEAAIVRELDLDQLRADAAEERIERQRVAYLLTAGGEGGAS